MKIPTKHKEMVLKKVNVLIKEFLVNRYLLYGNSLTNSGNPCSNHANDEEMELLKSLIRKLLIVQDKLESNPNFDFDVQFLRWIDGEYQKLFNENMEKQV